MLLLAFPAAAGGACDVELGDTPILPNFDYVNDAPRHNSARRNQIEEWWREGCPQLIAQDVRGPHDNLVCKLDGTASTTNGDMFVVGAHFDKVRDGNGVADNWSGIVLLNALLQHYWQNEHELNLEFVAFAGEEKGLYGAKAYIKAHTEQAQSDQVQGKIVGMLNLDSIGLGELIIDTQSDSNLRCQAQEIARSLKINSRAKPAKGIKGDWHVFDKAGIPAVGLHSISRQTIGRIHNKQDRAGNVDVQLLKKAFLLAKYLIDSQIQDANRDQSSAIEPN